ncbi:uncharacterized protein (TIGR02145 family) [Parabacteroides sp. PF5-5]|uniref:FISUMP domain-containing protein n=1 Tax=unclassified Parabacteroides TaxID=2649774 RepID=UPI002474512F|nr:MULTISPECIES: FISUMP domain-containing protein [unclassified Parabacteroides]MDH6304717.1 uncharacterized protein (TIGR02145 family) [Parabacteroides sp. PH5-39]MDH6315668.1 uncharacterized protein (TIGR02145 family) [Parabacteroides sp. PF5-13]MDH6319329.1 uncharacterized protein (TIGR02145 family) [Parabacteroides sp. PH5-13]MDH6323060.1 uncharacterized protein (TIGR02145 family) [Parabacteroides sp. PH5-8]MDH6326861.1 uncharacterized protein (TIGR02145 family) [Parabacteroides sp. PH5-41
MKSKILKQYIVWTAAMLMLALSCSNEELPGAVPPVREGFITFTLPGKKQPISYVTASANENAVDSLVIYMFADGTDQNSPNLLEKVYRIGRAGLSQSGTSLTTTIDITGRSGKRVFYFVANGKGNASVLSDINVGTTTEEEFVERLSDVQNGFLSMPLLMTSRKEIEDVEFPTEDEKKVTLTRRVARFDVDNDASVTNFQIEKILIKDIHLQAYIFSNATGTAGQVPEVGNLPIINCSSQESANGSGSIEGLFYLYPTEIGQGKGGIWFEGVFMGERRIYHLKNELSIKPNKRYTLKVTKVSTEATDLEIVVDDWVDDGGSHVIEPETNDVVFSDITKEGGDGLLTFYHIYDITRMIQPLKLSVTVSSYNLPGARAVVVGNVDNLPGFKVNTKEPVLTYSMYYTQDFEILIPPPINPQVNIDIRIEIVNQLNTDQRLGLSIFTDVEYYPETTLLPVILGGKTWAPVNVGATKIDIASGVYTVEHMGYLYQWGRNTGFVSGGEDDDPKDVYPVAGGVSMYDATAGVAAGLFIKGGAFIYYDWLTTQDDNLWSGDKRQGPCPDGWHVPTSEDFSSITIAYNEGKATRDNSTGTFAITGDNGVDKLYFPAVGNRQYSTGKTYTDGMGYYWTATPSERHSYKYTFFVDGHIDGQASPRSYGYSVRCIKD